MPKITKSGASVAIPPTVIRLISEKCAAGESVADIRLWLNQAAIPRAVNGTVQVGCWDDAAVRELLGLEQ